MWEVSARALREIALLNEPSVLADAAREIGDSIPEDSSRGPAEDDVRTELEHACSDARQLHTGRVQQARDWWRLWRNEVSPFRDQKERLDAAFHASSGRRERGWEFASVVLDTVLLGSEPSTLVSDLRRDGAEFRGGDFHADSIGSLGGIAAWLPLVFWRDPEFHWWSRHFVEHWIHLQEVRVRQERERLLAPCVEAALAALRAQGGDAGPFLPYDVGGRPPSPELAAAYRQHLLPDGTASPWRMQWEARLDALPRGQALPHNWRAALDELTRQADATVRLGACTDAPRLGEPWPAYLQRVFEEKYVAVAAIGIAKPRRPDDALSVPAYAAFLAALTEKLVGMGYELTPPTAQRVDRLFVAVRKTGYASSGDW
ncbi:MAG: hypothetical protein IT379_30390 [Deltaproteobacteria bacterium]|nr:hypothetical protein [Deltaproteobacteria bacterium]